MNDKTDKHASTGQNVSFYSAGFKLAARLQLPPHSDHADHPAIVMCPGLASVKEMHLPAIASELNAHGYLTLAFDYRGFGESEGRRGVLNPMEEVEDAINAVTCVMQRNEVVAGKVGILGSSFGGAIATVAAALDQRIRASVVSVTMGDCERWLKARRSALEWKDFLGVAAQDRERRVADGRQRYIDVPDLMNAGPDWSKTVDLEGRARKYPTWSIKIAIESIDHILSFKPEEFAQKISPRAILFLAAAKDDLVSPSEIKKMYEKASEPKAFAVLNGAHYDIYSPPLLNEYVIRAAEWYEKYL